MTPCALCGAPDSRHRDIETQMGRVIAGEPIEDVAADYGLPPRPRRLDRINRPAMNPPTYVILSTNAYHRPNRSQPWRAACGTPTTGDPITHHDAGVPQLM